MAGTRGMVWGQKAARSRFWIFFLLGVGAQGTQGRGALLRHLVWQDIRQSRRRERGGRRERDRERGNAIEAWSNAYAKDVFLYYNVISDNTLAFEIAMGSLDVTVTLHTEKRKQIMLLQFLDTCYSIICIAQQLHKEFTDASLPLGSWYSQTWGQSWQRRCVAAGRERENHSK